MFYLEIAKFNATMEVPVFKSERQRGHNVIQVPTLFFRFLPDFEHFQKRLGF